MHERERQSLSVAQLEGLVRHHNKLYWDKAQPEISDVEYDQLVRRLRDLAPGSPVLDEMGSSAEAAREPGSEVRHRHRMLSLDKCYSESELLHWAESFEGDVMVSPKFDGVACSLLYDARGELLLAATRGDGAVGDDITANARGIADIPKRVSAREVEVRGEVFMRLSVFKQYKDQGFSNPRNLTAGAIKMKSAEKSAAYTLSFAAYDLLGTDHPTEGAKMDALTAMGFAPIECARVPKAEMQAQYDATAHKRAALDFEIDGVVYRVDSVAEQRRLGSTAHHPRYAIAYKFQGDSGTTVLRAIEWSVARSGAITPIAIIDPVWLSGANVSRVSLHHAGYIAKLGLALNAEVIVTRRGGVIPNVESVSKAGDTPIPIPTACPSCGGAVRAEKDFLYCADPSQCRAAVVGQLAHYAGTTDMLGFGDAVLNGAFERKYLRRPADFYTLTEAQLLTLDRMGDKLAKKLIAEVDKSRTQDLATFLRAFGLPELGKHVSALLAERYVTLEQVFAVTVEELAAIHSVGDVIAEAVVRGLREGRAEIEAVARYVTITAPQAADPRATDGPFVGKTFVFTGKMATMERKAAEALVRKLGGTPLDAVNKTLSVLVIGDKKTADKSTKQKAAEKLIAQGAPIEVISESEFLVRAETPTA